MKVNGPPETPLLTGKVQIARGGKVTFRNNTFEIISGQVEYQNSPPENPTLNVQAQAQVNAQLKNGETRSYDVDLRVLGPANDPKVTMYSEPSLPETELLSLLTLGFITEASTEEDTEASAGDQLTNTSYQLGSAFLNEQLGINRALESRFGVQFDFNSSYDMSDKVEKHKFTLRKQWTPKFGTSASREIGKTSTSNVKAEYKLNKNLSVIGEWEGKEAVGAEQTTDISQKNQNLFGLDIEYKVEFK
jgi:translocation and assembly module TamB